MNEFFKNCTRGIHCDEITANIQALHTFMISDQLIPLFAPPNHTAGLAFALGMRYGKHIERERLGRFSFDGTAK